MQFRQLLLFLVLALLGYMLYQRALDLVFPKRTPPPATQPGDIADETPPTGSAPETAPTQLSDAPATSEATPRRELVLIEGSRREVVTIGGGRDDLLQLTLTPRGAGVLALRLTQRADGRYLYRTAPRQNEPYEILDREQMLHRPRADGRWPAEPDDWRAISFLTRQLLIKELGNRPVRLDERLWTMVESSATRAAFTLTLRRQDGDADLLRVTKTYELVPGRPLVRLSLTFENLGPDTLSVVVEQEGAASIRRESPMYDMRRLTVAASDGQVVKIAKSVQRGEVQKKTAAGESSVLFTAPGQGRFVWAALTNRFFGVFMRPVTDDGPPADFVQLADAVVLEPATSEHLGDLVVQLTAARQELQPAQSARLSFEIHAGPKDADLLAAVNADFADKQTIGYSLAATADTACCTFQPLPALMTGLLHGIRVVVRNYGIAIIILVIIVRTLLHPLTVYQQKQMYRMQDAMLRLQPKLEAVREQYKNDRVRLNQEMMKVYAEEGVNPMGTLVGMLPLMLQMPILVALWSALNADIQLRHAPFDGWWIKDLAAPDALITFATPITLPILGWLPLIGWMFQNIPAFNLLPIVMGLSMYFQQKYMPKPAPPPAAPTAKHEPPKPRRPGQLTPEEQMRQQRIMMWMMTIMMPLMLYYMPSGLNLYWMATNVFGIGESLLIRKQLQHEKERRERAGHRPPPKQAGLMTRLLKRMAAQAEEIQRKADELSAQDRAPRPRKERQRDSQ